MCCFNDEFQRSSCNPYHPFCIESHWPYISSLNVLRCSNVRPGRMMLSSNMPMGLWAMSEYERKSATLNGYSLGLCQRVCLLHTGVPKIIKESDLMVEAASHRLQATPFPRLQPSQAIKTQHEERSKSFHMAGRYHVQS